MYKAVIAGYSRSPFTLAKKGELINVKPVNLLAEVIKNLVSKSKVNPNDIEDVVVGCAFQVGEQCFNIGKLVTFLAGMDIKTSGMTVDRWCGSSMEAIHIAAGKIALGSGKAFICGGVESMSRVTTGFDPVPYPYSEKENPNVYFSMGITAENVSKDYEINREMMDNFALSSQQKAFNAIDKGYFSDQITSIEIKKRKEKITFKIDEHIRPNTKIENLSALKPAFDPNGNVTAGNSSGINDGAAALILAKKEEAMKNKKKPLAKIVSYGFGGVPARIMGMGPVPATKMAL